MRRGRVASPKSPAGGSLQNVDPRRGRTALVFACREAGAPRQRFKHPAPKTQPVALQRVFSKVRNGAAGSSVKTVPALTSVLKLPPDPEPSSQPRSAEGCKLWPEIPLGGRRSVGTVKGMRCGPQGRERSVKPGRGGGESVPGRGSHCPAFLRGRNGAQQGRLC